MGIVIARKSCALLNTYTFRQGKFELRIFGPRRVIAFSRRLTDRKSANLLSTFVVFTKTSLRLLVEGHVGTSLV